MNTKWNEKIGNCRSIDELFALWKEAQKEDTETQRKDSLIPREAFIPDGIIDEAEYAHSSKKILVIAKESHQYKRKCNTKDNILAIRAQNVKNATFWLQKVAVGEETSGLVGTRIAAMVHAIRSGNYESIEKSVDVLKSIAYMNLNKRGGYEECDPNVLQEYTSYYGSFIAKEIELIKPDLIIICGVALKEMLSDSILSPAALKGNARFVFTWHPSYPRKDEAHLMKLQQAMQAPIEYL